MLADRPFLLVLYIQSNFYLVFSDFHSLLNLLEQTETGLITESNLTVHDMYSYNSWFIKYIQDMNSKVNIHLYYQVLVLSDDTYEISLPYFFSYKTKYFFSFHNNPKNVDPSYETNLDL